VGHHDATAVDALPQPYGEGIFLSVLIERAGAPHQFLRREAYQAAVGSRRRHVVGKAEAVGQEHVVRLRAELLPVERLAEQDVANPRFGRADDDLVGVPTAAGQVPAVLADALGQLLPVLGIVLLHPIVLDGTLEVEDVVGIVAHEGQVLFQRGADVVTDGGLDVPVPLRVEVGIRYHEGRGAMVVLCGR